MDEEREEKKKKKNGGREGRGGVINHISGKEKRYIKKGKGKGGGKKYILYCTYIIIINKKGGRGIFILFLF